MRIYDNLFEAARECERDLFEMGIKSKSSTHQNHDVSQTDDFESKELYGYSYSIPMVEAIGDDDNIHKALEYLGKDPIKSLEYCSQEISDRLLGHPNPGTSYLLNRELWEQFMTAGKFDYTYAERYHKSNQLIMVVDELYNNIESRRAVLSVYDLDTDTLLRDVQARIPCSMYYQFIVREEEGEMKLNVIYVMRSCDFYEHWAHDVILTWALSKYICSMLNTKNDFKVELGRFIHQLGSFHMFKKDYSKREIY